MKYKRGDLVDIMSFRDGYVYGRAKIINTIRDSPLEVYKVHILEVPQNSPYVCGDETLEIVDQLQPIPALEQLAKAAE